MEEIILKGICDLYCDGDFDKIINSDSVYEYKDTILDRYAKAIENGEDDTALDDAILNALAHGELTAFLAA